MMLKYCLKKWHENKDKLETAIRKNATLNYCDYRYLLELLVKHVLNDGECGEYDKYKLQADHITEIDNGNYQGTLLFVIPFDTYQPSEYEYLMTYVGYGSCSGCDALQAIQSWGEAPPTELQVKEYMSLCKDMLTNMIKPYNYGWREDQDFAVVEMDDPPEEVQHEP